MSVPISASSYAQANRFYRVMRRMGGWRPVSWLYARILPSIDRFFSRVTGGKMTAGGLFSGLPVLLLTTTGARTGAERTEPLVYLRSGEDFGVIASNWGQRYNPGWYHNLRANARAKVTLDGATFDVVAREATEAERNQYWTEGILLYPAWNVYKARSPRSQFPILVLSQATTETRTQNPRS